MKFATAILLAAATAGLMATALATLLGRLTVGIAWGAVLAGLVVSGIALWQMRKTRARLPRMGTWEGVAVGCFIVFALRAFLWLVYADGDALIVLSPNNLGDYSLHLTYVRLLANGGPFWPENPIFSGMPLTYPIGTDLLNALLSLLGVEVFRGFIWVGLVASACTLAALWKWDRGFAVAGFLFAGGLFGFAIFWRGQLVDYQSDLVWTDGTEVAWKSLPLALFVTQRGLLYALPAGLLLLASWRNRFLGWPDHWTLPAWSEVLLYAAMPLFHLHTFLFLSAVAAVWFLALARARRHLGWVVAAAFLPASLLVWRITDGFSGPSLLGWQPGWMQGDQNFLIFWLMNFGLLPILVGTLIYETIVMRQRDAALLLVPALGIFLICCFVKFAPWAWDNTKLMFWSYLMILPVLRRDVLAPMPEPARIVAIVVLFFSGAVSLFGGLSERENGYPFAVRSELDAVAAALKPIPATAVFVAHPTYNHPLLLNGRLLTLGYPGHVWSHGLDRHDREAAVTSILRGEDGWQDKARALGADYLFWGREEAAAYPDSTQPWQQSAQLLSEDDAGAIYKLR